MKPLQLNLKKVVSIGFFAILGILIVISTIWFQNTSENSERLQRMVDRQVSSKYVFDMRDAAYKRALLLSRMALVGDSFFVNDELPRFNNLAADFIQARDAFLNHNLAPEEKAMFDSTRENIRAGGRVQIEARDLLIDDRIEEAMKKVVDDVIPTQDAVMRDMTKLMQLEQDFIQMELVEASRNTAQTTLLVLTLVMVAISLGVGIMFYVLRATSRIENDLVTAREDAQKANELKSQFLANMSHEIRTPMNAIIGMTHLLDKTVLEKQQHDYVNKIQTASRSLLGIINDILDFSKVEAGKLQIEKHPFDLNKIFEQLNSIIDVSVLGKYVEIKFVINPNVPRYLIGDSLRIGQILTNLVSNAVKFTEEGEVKVSCNMIRSDAETAVLKFEVADTGIGMTEEQMSGLFSAFSQADSSTTRRFGGTGLGLSICKRLVDIMGGEMDVKSQAGKGSVFSFVITFDLASQEQCEKLVQELNVEINNFANISTSGKRILLIEDNEINRQVATEILQSDGFIVEQAENGQVGVDILKKGIDLFDLVLVDLHMPVMDGFETVDAIRNKMNLADLPVIAMTADAIAGTRQKCIDAGMNDYVTKPIDVNELRTVISRQLGIIAKHRENNNNPRLVIKHEYQYINISQGLERIAHNTKLYLNLIKTFQLQYKEISEELALLVDNSDYEQVYQYIHTLKGVAGNLGADSVNRVANSIMEKLTNRQFTEAESMLQVLITETKMTLGDINTLLSDNLSQDIHLTTEKNNIQNFKAEIDLLISMLEKNDMGAMKQFELIEQSGHLDADIISQVSENINNLDFSSANELLRNIKI